MVPFYLDQYREGCGGVRRNMLFFVVWMGCMEAISGNAAV